MAFNPPAWGGEQTSKDYEMMMQGSTPVETPISLVGHSLTGLTPETIDAITVNRVSKQKGRIVTTQRTLRPQQQIAITGTLGFGAQLWTPIMNIARRAGSACPVTFYAKRLCPPDSEFAHAYIWPDAILNPPQRVNDPVTIDDEVPIEWSSEFRVERELTLWTTDGYELTDLSDPLYAVGFTSEDCADCQEGFFQGIVAVGGPGGGTQARVYVSDDRFASNTLGTHSAPAGSIANSLFVDGSTVLVGFANTTDPTTAATGGTLYSVDGGLTLNLDSDLTLPVWGVAKFNGQFLAVGGQASSGAKIWTSADGVSYDAVSSTTLTALSSEAITAVSVDDDEGVFYAVTTGGTVLKGRASGSGISITEIEGHGASGVLNSVNVFGADHVGIGGASNFYAETFDGGEEWENPEVPGSSSVLAIAGTPERAMVGAGAAYVRDLLNDFIYTEEDYRDGVTVSGDVTGLAIDKTDELDGFNYFVGVTDDGEIIMFRPNFPNA